VYRITSIHLMVLITIVGLAGCSDSLPRTIRVEGQVTYGGKPVTSGTVAFMPLETPGQIEPRPATGALRADGTYQLACYRAKAGVLPGKYAVSVVAYKHFAPPQNPDDKPDYAVPERYTNAQTSGLTATVPADAADPLRFDFQLQD
jgi:hypothetical protein